MMQQISELACLDPTLGPQLEQLKIQMQRNQISKHEFDIRRYALTGQPPTQGTEFDDFMTALTHLGGEGIPLEMGGGEIVASPPWLEK